MTMQRHLTFLLAVACLVALFGGCAEQGKPTAEPTNTTTTTTTAFLSDSSMRTEAQTVAMELGATLSGYLGNELPDNYGGYYLDGPTLVVVVTDDAAMAEYQTVLTEQKITATANTFIDTIRPLSAEEEAIFAQREWVRYQKGEHSYSALYGMFERTRMRMQNKELPLTTVSLSQKHNRVCVTIADESEREPLLAALTPEEIAMLDISIGSGGELI